DAPPTATKPAAKKAGTKKGGKASVADADDGADAAREEKAPEAGAGASGEPTEPLEAPGDEPAEETVAILDIPLKKSARAPRRISSKDAAQLLDSVLEALPEPAQPGTGRSRGSRRASSAQLAAQQ